MPQKNHTVMGILGAAGFGGALFRFSPLSLSHLLMRAQHMRERAGCTAGTEESVYSIFESQVRIISTETFCRTATSVME